MEVDLAGVITAVTALIQAIGLGPAVVISLAIIGISFAVMVYRDYRARSHFDVALEAKEQQIQRLADECRGYREYLFAHWGMTLMRAPGGHGAAAQAVFDATSPSRSRGSSTNPFRNAPPEIGQLLLDFANALDLLLADYSLIWWCAKWVSRRLGADHIPLWVAARAAEIREAERLREAQQQLEFEGQRLLAVAA